MAFDEQLAERVRRHFAQRRLPTEEKRMMGGLCFMVRDKMCVGVEKERLMVRLDPAREAEALARRGCTPMDFTGRPMRGYVFVARDGWTSDADLGYWLALALEFNPRAKSSKAARRRPAAPRRAQATRKVSPGRRGRHQRDGDNSDAAPAQTSPSAGSRQRGRG